MKPYHDQEWLKQAHLIEKKSISAIAKECGVTYQAVDKYLKQYGIKKVKTVKKQPRKYNCNDRYFREIDTPEKAYWLGFIMADGSIFCPSKHEGSVQMRLAINLMKSDNYHLGKFLKAINSNHPVGYHTVKESYFKADGREVTIRESEGCHVTINSYEMCRDLKAHGVTQKKTLNEQVPNISDELVKHFIRGYFDGDGSFSLVKPKDRPNEYPKVFIASGEKIIDFIIEKAREQTKIEMGKDYYKKLTRCYLQSRINIITFMNWIYDGANVHLDRKYKDYQSYLLNI